MDFLPAPLKFLWSPENYWYTLVSAYVGAWLGIRWTKLQFRNQEKARRVKSLKGLSDSIDSNVQLITIARSVLTANPPGIPNFPFDANQLSNWIAACHDFLSPDLVAKLDWQRLQLEHIGQKFMIMNSGMMSTIGNSLMTPAQAGYLSAVISSLLQHLKQTEDALIELKSDPQLDSVLA